MPELHTVKLTSPQIRSAVSVLSQELGNLDNVVALDLRRQDALVDTYLALVRAQMSETGWRPQGVELSPWAVEALARVTTPPPAPKAARAVKPAAPAAPKRKRRDARKRHDRPRAATTEIEPALPMTDDVDVDISAEVLQ